MANERLTLAKLWTMDPQKALAILEEAKALRADDRRAFVESLVPEMAQLVALCTIPYCPWVPHPRQAEFLCDLGREAFYGGSAGPGKSAALLMAALQFVHVPGYAALLLRRTFPDLQQPTGLMNYAEEWFSGFPDVKLDDKNHTYEFPSGAAIRFGYIESKRDRERYLGGAYQFIGWDELTQHRETDYRFLFRSQRRPSAGLLSRVPIRTRGASNPGSVGHEWVARRFGVVGRGIQDAEIALKRRFYAARLEDNPHLDREEYELSLNELGSVDYAHQRHGDWSARPEGRKFHRSWFVGGVDANGVHHPSRIIGRDELPDGIEWVRSWDFAATEADSEKDPDWTVGTLYGRHANGTYYVGHVVRGRWSDLGVEERVKRTCVRDGRDVDVVIEEEPGASGKQTTGAMRRRVIGDLAVCRVVRPSGDKVARTKLCAARAEAGDVFLVRGAWNDTWLDEIETFPDGEHDDQVDSWSQAHNHLAGRLRVVTTGSPVSMESPSQFKVG